VKSTVKSAVKSPMKSAMTSAMKNSTKTPRSRAALTLAALAFALNACTPPQEVDAIEFQVPVSVEEVVNGSVESKIVTSGNLRASEIETLTALVAGTLQISDTISADGTEARRLAEGDRISAGDEIAFISGEDVRLEVGRESIQQRFNSARLDYESARRLNEQGLLNASELNKLQAAMEDAKLALERSQRTEARAHLVSSIDGVVLKLARDAKGQPMSNGQLVAPGLEIAQVAPLDELIADIDLVGRDGLALVQVGQEARVNHHAWSDESFTGRVLRIAPTVNEQTRALRAEVAIDNRSGVLRPGMFVEVTLIVERHENVPVVSRRAITERGGRSVAFVLRGQRVAQVDVTLGLGDDENIEVRSGVNAGDRVVVRGLETLTDQMPVRVTNL
jgi:membrane fusion protein, multidrug efflux system